MRNLEVEKEDISVYEIGYLVLPSIPEDNLTQVTDAIRAVITKAGGTEIDAEEPFKELLAYPMSKTIGASRYVLKDAYLGWVKFEAERDKAQTIKSGLEKIEEILRFLMIKAQRETTFTLAKARAAMEAPTLEEVGVPTPDLDQGVGKENVVK